MSLYVKMAGGSIQSLAGKTLEAGEFYFVKDQNRWFVGTDLSGNIELTNKILSLHIVDTSAHAASTITVDKIETVDGDNVQTALEYLGIKVAEAITISTENSGRLTELESRALTLENQTINLENQVEELQIVVGEIDYRGVLESLEEWKGETVTYVDNNYITNTQKGQPYGVATLGPDGIVPNEQLPETQDRTDIELLQNKNQPNGYAGLDENKYVPNENINPSIAQAALVTANNYTDNETNTLKEYVNTSISNATSHTNQSISELTSYVNTQIDKTVSDVDAAIAEFSPFRYGHISPIYGCTLGGSDGKRLVDGRGILDNLWVVCDGTNGTPNLVYRFIYGATTPTNAGLTGGSTTATLSVANMPSHTHTGASHYHGFSGSVSADGGHQHSQGASNTAATTIAYAFNGNGVASYINTSAGGAHAHTFNGNSGYNSAANTGATGSGAAFSIMPPYYTLMYFMFIGGN